MINFKLYVEGPEEGYILLDTLTWPVLPCAGDIIEYYRNKPNEELSLAYRGSHTQERFMLVVTRVQHRVNRTEVDTKNDILLLTKKIL